MGIDRLWLNVVKDEAKCPNFEKPFEIDVFSFLGQLSAQIQPGFPLGNFKLSSCAYFAEMGPLTPVEQEGKKMLLWVKLGPVLLASSGRICYSWQRGEPSLQHGKPA